MKNKNVKENKYVRSRHASLKALTRPFLGFVLNPKYKDPRVKPVDEIHFSLSD